MAKKKNKSKKHERSVSTGQKKAVQASNQKKDIQKSNEAFENKYLDIKLDNNINKNADIRVTSPYNFIEFPNHVFVRYENFEQLPTFDRFDKKLNTGYIDYEFENETELFVGGEKNSSNQVDLFKNTKGEYVIPGSTMKGVFRNNTEVLGFGYPEFVEDRTFMYRNFAEEDSSKNQYNSIVGQKGKNIDAGYIYKEGSVYKLIPAKKIGKKSWLSISEKKLMEMLGVDIEGINYMYDESLLDAKIRNGKDWDEYCNEHASDEYTPYVKDITFDVKGNKITKISIGEDLPNKGIICNTNYIHGKSKHYIIPEMDDEKYAVEINSTHTLNYKKDYESNNQIKNKDFYLLPEKDGIKNKMYFFYKIENSEVKYLGKSPLLRIFFDKSVRACITVNDIGSGIDYPSAIYGYADENNGKYSLDRKQNYKSRVSFTDVKIPNPNIKAKQYEMILSSPKGSCYKFYLKQDGVSDKKQIMTYNARIEGDNIKNPEIRGRKFYWNKDFKESELDINKSKEKNINLADNKEDKQDNQNVKVKIKQVLERGNKFVGRIYFENLSDDELGLLLLSIKLKSDCKENIGMAKPYGMGRVDIDKIKLYLEDIGNKFKGLSPKYRKADDIKYKESYLNYIGDYLKTAYNKDFCDIKQIKDFYKSKMYIGNVEDFRYMDLDEFSEFRILPRVYEI